MWSFPAGQVFGIPVRLHISWIVLLILGVFALDSFFAARIGGSGVALALATTLFILLAILFHELGHALIARRLGANVRTITLFLSGGLTELEDDLTRPEHELWVALAGPLVSLILAVVSAGIALLTDGGYRLMCLILAGSNAILTIFNLLPCFPLDGGRALRAALWFFHDDLLDGTWIATQIGRLIGWMLIALGIVVVVDADAASGLLMILLGWMTSRAALNTYLQTALTHILRQVTVRELMSQAYRTVSPHLTLDLFVGQYLIGQSDQGFPVIHAERLMGLMTVRSLHRFSAYQWRETLVGEAMIPSNSLPSIKPDDDAHTAYQALLSQHFEQLPVTSGNILMGMIRYHDVVSFVQKRLQERHHKTPQV